MEELNKGLVINGRYLLERYIGSGSFGEVWEANDHTTGEIIAIKIYVSLDKKGCDEFLSEYQIASGLNHENLLTTKSYEIWQSRPLLTMGFCEKGSAGKLVGTLHPSKEDEKTLWRFLRDVGSGLAFLHNIEPDPIVHQDIKPDNILVDSNGTFLITDFGISKRVRSTLRSQSQRAGKAGAVAYMGPERFSKNPAPILASDVWSLGASLYELAEGELPFAGQGGIMLKNGAEMADLSSGWSSALNEAMHKCLEPLPWNRIKAHELAEMASEVLADFDNFYAKVQQEKETAAPKSRTFDPRATQQMAAAAKELNAAADKLNAEAQKPMGQKPVAAAAMGNTDSLTQEPQKKKSSAKIISIIAAVIVAVAIAFAVYATREDPDIQAAKEALPEYKELVETCTKKTADGDNSNTTALLEAKEALIKLKGMEASYYTLMPKDYASATQLETALNAKLKEAAAAWAEAANAQAEMLEDYDQATSFYELSLQLWPDEKVQAEFDKVSEKKKK